ncbi:MAG: beta-glucosidase-related glycosidase [Butyrivibrio sp.]|nr:beta-glucosidase-related glycosidase [Butyrivibrio sp.]
MERKDTDKLSFVLSNAAECTVLLKKSGQFPLDKPGKIAAYGAGLRYTIKGGTGSGEVNSKETFTIEQGLERAGFIIASKSWLDAYDEVRRKAKKQFIKDLKAQAKAKHENAIMYSMGKTMKEPDHNLEIAKVCDTAIYVVSRNSGEGSDREVLEGDVKLSKSEIRDILLLNKMYDRFMLVLNVGGVVDLSPVMEVKDILLLSQLGTDCGAVLADILLGKQNPSGKLSTTWAEIKEYSVEGTFGDWNDNRYKEGIYVGYRYFDTFKKTALFPFGFGLSYTTFETKVSDVKANKDTLTCEVLVKNTGSCSGKEVVQVYLSVPEDKLDQPYQQLVCYAKTPLLERNAECRLEMSFRLSDFASYDEESESYVLEKGRYVIRVGNSSVDTKIAAVAILEETVTTLKTRNCLGKPDFTDIKSEHSEPLPIPEGIVTFALTADDFEKREVFFDNEVSVDSRIKNLTDEELSYMQIGNFDPNAKGLSIIGNAATHLAGAAGETTSQLVNKGIRPLIMADGPAGIRISLKYYEEGENQYDTGNKGMMPESMLEMMGPVTAFIAKLIVGGKKIPRNAVIKEHSATMIPIGTAIAQSFNTELAEALGDIVGEEMEKFGVHLWLAPALNIHRSILCGRNFEYYSEDPLVSGEVAAAITRGVQKHKRCGTTIKHYAANNAETNRYCNNSQVSERAMREIYLRGFDICIRKSQPKAVMTSYNLLNGIHTSEHRGLIEDVLRGEFGFKGIVMTDWVMTIMTSSKSKYRNALSDEVAKAGGELFMPGTKKDYERVLKALKDGTLSRKQLEINASRLIRTIDEFYAD